MVTTSALPGEKSSCLAWPISWLDGHGSCSMMSPLRDWASNKAKYAKSELKTEKPTPVCNSGGLVDPQKHTQLRSCRPRRPVSIFLECARGTSLLFGGQFLTTMASHDNGDSPPWLPPAMAPHNDDAMRWAGPGPQKETALLRSSHATASALDRARQCPSPPTSRPNITSILGVKGVTDGQYTDTLL